MLTMALREANLCRTTNPSPQLAGLQCNSSLSHFVPARISAAGRPFPAIALTLQAVFSIQNPLLVNRDARREYIK